MPPIHEHLMDIAVKRGFLIPSAEAYGSPGGFYDYGPAGASVKRRLQELWRRLFITEPGYFEIETSAVLPEAVLIASGHAGHFADPLAKCPKCKQPWRADHLLEKKTLKSWAGKNPEEMTAGLKAENICCPSCKSPLEAVGWFNLMFATSIGGSADHKAYLRPETAQGIFLDFGRIYREHGGKLPLAIGQVGRSFRNEISPRQGLVRMREFSQMELEYFFNPKRPGWEGFAAIADYRVRILPPADGDARTPVQDIALSEALGKGYFPNEIFAMLVWRQDRMYRAAGIPREKYYFKVMPKDETPHYSMGNVDLEVETSYGLVETAGTAYRTDFDLASHAKHSKQDLSVFVEEEKAKIIPHVVEPSMGVDRMFYCVLEHCYRPASPGKEWEWFALPPAIAPYAAGIFPLMKKDGLDEMAQKLVGELREEGLEVYYSQSGSIGRRYARADEIGVPFGITVDYTTKEDSTVTIRYRDDGKQERVKMGELAGKLRQLVKEGKTRLG